MLVLLLAPPWKRQDLNQVSNKHLGTICPIYFLLEFMTAYSLYATISHIMYSLGKFFLFEFLSVKPLWRDLGFLPISFLGGPQNGVCCCLVSKLCLTLL